MKDEKMVDFKSEPTNVKNITAFDGVVFPICPSCGEIAYEYDRCLFCGQRFNAESFPEENDVVSVRTDPVVKLSVEKK